MPDHVVCRLDELAADRGLAVDLGRFRLAVFLVGGQPRVVGGICLHTGAPLEDALVDPRRGRLTCPWHGWCYDVRTGERLVGEGHREPGVGAWPAWIVGNEVHVDLDPDSDPPVGREMLWPT